MRKQALPLLHRLAYVTRVSEAAARWQPVMRIVMIHSVAGPYCTPEGFRQQMEFLATRFHVVPLGELVRRAGEDRRGRRIAALTFDDGLRNTCTVAYPILKALGLPATVFVCPALLDKGGWLWNQESRARLNFMSAGHSLHGAAGRNPGPVGVEGIVEWMKTLPLRERRSMEEAIRQATPCFQPTPEQRLEYDLMTWQELQSLDPALITVGAHTMTHPILPTLLPGELEYEVGESRRALEQRLGVPAPHFCYPNGSRDDIVVRTVARFFDSSVTTEIGVVRAGTCRHQLPRIPIASDAERLAWRMHRPAS